MKFQNPLSIKSSGDGVKWIQSKLKEFGYFKGRVDGFFGQDTLISVTSFQRNLGIKASGVVDRQTWIQLANLGLIKEEATIDEKSDLLVSFTNETGLTIYDSLISSDDYYQLETKKDTIFLHQTNGSYRPDWSIGMWDKDYDRDKKGNLLKNKPLKTGVSYVIGRYSSIDPSWDGKVLKSFDDRYWAYHLDISKNKNLNSRSIGIEICNYGPLTQGRDGRFYNSVNQPIDDKDVTELSNEFKGFKYYERYTDAQLESTRNLILYLENKWGIEIDRGIYNESWFDFNEMWISNGGLRSHSQVSLSKYDIFPQKEMIEMLNSL